MADGTKRRDLGLAIAAASLAVMAAVRPRPAFAADEPVRIAAVDSFSGPVGNLGHGTRTPLRATISSGASGLRHGASSSVGAV